MVNNHYLSVCLTANERQSNAFSPRNGQRTGQGPGKEQGLTGHAKKKGPAPPCLVTWLTRPAPPRPNFRGALENLGPRMPRRKP